MFQHKKYFLLLFDIKPYTNISYNRKVPAMLVESLENLFERKYVTVTYVLKVMLILIHNYKVCRNFQNTIL